MLWTNYLFGHERIAYVIRRISIKIFQSYRGFRKQEGKIQNRHASYCPHSFISVYLCPFMKQTAPTILYEDNHIIAVNKPAGWLVQGDETGDKPLSDWLKEYIKEKFNKPGDVYLGVLHRIDRPVSGIVLFARTSKAAERMSKMFQQGGIEKYYSAEVKGFFKNDNGALESYITRNEANNTSKSHLNEVPDSKHAKLEYKVVKRGSKHTLLEILLHTGRHHQIRAQLSAIRCPIVGDVKYGFPTPNADGSINLHACRVVFEHPVTKKEVVIESKPGF
jgi:23S rRNA pseudouridine1911/1915/1917 synthase